MHWPFSRAATARIVPFALFMLLLGLRGALPVDNLLGVDPRWIYGLSLLLVGASIAWFWRDYGELALQLRPGLRETALACGTGIVVFLLWIRLDAPWMIVSEPTATFVPLDADGRPLWALIAVRWVGAALLVPLVEELFWRSFLMRWLKNGRFESVPPERVGLRAVVLSCFVFMLAHTLWLAAIVAGLAYAWLYIRTGKLWVAVIAHAVTNGALGIWVVATGQWAYW